MIHWQLALRRFLRPGGVLLLAVTLLAVWAAGGAGSSAALRPCGVYCGDTHDMTRQTAAVLAERGFPIYDSREAMEADISFGVLDCGAVLLPGLGQALSQGRPGGNVLLLTAPDSFLTEAYEARIFAVLYAAAAPAMTRISALEAGVSLTQEQVEGKLAEMKAAGNLFTFELSYVEGAPAEERDLGRDIAKAAAGLLLCAAILPGTVRLVKDADSLWPRIGRRRALTRILLPGLVWQGLAFFCGVAVVLPSAKSALPGFLLLLTAAGLVAGRLPPGPGLPLMLLGSLAAFPMYYDLAESFPPAALLRWVLPPCWLLKAWEYPLPAGLLGAGLTVLILVFYPKRRHIW